MPAASGISPPPSQANYNTPQPPASNDPPLPRNAATLSKTQIIVIGLVGLLVIFCIFVAGIIISNMVREANLRNQKNAIIETIYHFNEASFNLDVYGMVSFVLPNARDSILSTYNIARLVVSMIPAGRMIDTIVSATIHHFVDLETLYIEVTMLEGDIAIARSIVSAHVSVLNFTVPLNLDFYMVNLYSNWYISDIRIVM